MWKQDPKDPYQVGTLVRLRNSGRRAKIVEYCGALGPKGASVYCLMVRRKPSPSYIEVLADQMDLWVAPEASEGRDEVESSTTKA